jgi:hypothetical protein
MRSERTAKRWSPRQAAVFGCALAAVTAAGCGGTGHAYKNTNRPPAPIVVSASIDDQQVSVSPKRFGAGPITLVITNQSTAAQQITLETATRPGSGPGEQAVQTGPINPRETASINAIVKQGTYALHVGGQGVRPARLVVGHQRKSSQNDLLQP